MLLKLTYFSIRLIVILEDLAMVVFVSLRVIILEITTWLDILETTVLLLLKRSLMDTVTAASTVFWLITTKRRSLKTVREIKQVYF